MIDRLYISEKLNQLGFADAVLSRYDEKHRFYHTLNHLSEVLTCLKQQGGLDDELFLAAVFHDAVYDPRATDNEEKSAELFEEEAKKTQLKPGQVNRIKQYIIDTKTHQASDKGSQLLINADLDIFNQPLNRLLDYERQIFKEFQFIEYREYQNKRIEILNSLNKEGKLNLLLDYVTYRKPKIAVFCGSFNPFHKGHFNILQKAERIFDKVIIAFGKNPEKNDRTWAIPNAIKNRQLSEYNGLLTDYVASIAYPVVVIRGLRNSTDFDYEQNQYRYIQELMPEINIVNIFCDKEFEHISSSGIRTLEKYDKHQNYLLD